MNGIAIQRPRELRIAEKDMDLLEYLCKTICDKIERRKPIYEKTVMDFSILIARIIHIGGDIKLPSVFDELVESLEEYWFYSAYQDEDKELSFSYIRIYQDVSMYKAFIEDNIYEMNIQSASIRYKKYYKLLLSIHDNPELTHGDLAKLLKLNVSNLSQRISSLIEEGYIYASRVGKYKFYSLSNKGLELLNALSAREKEAPSALPQPFEKELLQQIYKLTAAKDEYAFAKNIPDPRWTKLWWTQNDEEEENEKRITTKLVKRSDDNNNFAFSVSTLNCQNLLNLNKENIEDNIFEVGKKISMLITQSDDSLIEMGQKNDSTVY